MCTFEFNQREHDKIVLFREQASDINFLKILFSYPVKKFNLKIFPSEILLTYMKLHHIYEFLSYIEFKLSKTNRSKFSYSCFKICRKFIFFSVACGKCLKGTKSHILCNFGQFWDHMPYSHLKALYSNNKVHSKAHTLLKVSRK